MAAPLSSLRSASFRSSFDTSTTIGAAASANSTASAATDPFTLTSWQDAFEYPIPTIQKFEKQIRNRGNDNRDKLRSLVSASYRQLLETAEQIMTMNGQMERLDSQLATIKNVCSLDRAEKAHRNWEKCIVKDPQDFTLSAQLSILQACPSAISRLLKSNSILLASKVHVLASLLRKSLSDQPNCPPFVKGPIQKSLNMARAKLCRRIDFELAGPESDISEIVNVLLAHSLVTVSTPLDAYIHFHRIRRDTILRMLAPPDEDDQQSTDVGKDKEMMLKAFKLWIKTIRQSHHYLPSSLRQGFEVLSSVPLVSDPRLHALRELRFDLHLNFVSPGIRNVKPLAQLATFTEQRCKARLGEWIEDTQREFVAALRANLMALSSKDSLSSLDGLVGLRNQIIREWLRESSLLLQRSTSTDQLPIQRETMLEALRGTFRDVISAAISVKVDGLLTFFQELNAAVSTPSIVSQRVPSLWDGQVASLAVRGGDSKFKIGVLKRVLARNGSLDKMASNFLTCLESIESARYGIEGMRSHSWNHEFGDRGLELENAASSTSGGKSTAQELHNMLAEEDPSQLMDMLEKKLTSAAASMRARVGGLVESVSKSIDEHAEHSASQGIFLIRVIRIIQTANCRTGGRGAVKPLLQPNENQPPQLSLAPLSTCTTPQVLSPAVSLPIYQALVHRLLSQPIAKFGKSLRRTFRAPPLSTQRKKYVTSDLWESSHDGALVLPAMPSLLAFGLVKDVCEEMMNMGTDLWTSEGRAVVREGLEQEVAACVERVLGNWKSGEILVKEVDGLGDGDEIQPETGANEEAENPDAQSEEQQQQREQEQEQEERRQKREQERQSCRYHHQTLMIVLLFDLFYLLQAFSARLPSMGYSDSASDSSISAIIQTVSRQAGFAERELDGGDEAEERVSVGTLAVSTIQARAEAYWGRTGALFGMLHD